MGVIEFVEWFRERIAISGLTQREIAMRAGISEAQVSRVLSGERNPSSDFCINIARALNVPVDIALQKAGFLSANRDGVGFKEAAHLFHQLSDRQQEDMLAIMRAMIQARQRRKDDFASQPA